VDGAAAGPVAAEAAALGVPATTTGQLAARLQGGSGSTTNVHYFTGWFRQHDKLWNAFIHRVVLPARQIFWCT
jgi:hypothetical protein